jgi:hypothetical protein
MELLMIEKQLAPGGRMDQVSEIFHASSGS